jgi:DNA mismatch repair protein MutL
MYMNEIKQLSQEVISKIAAGEVIERPVYAVKELVENSLDAGADSVIVHVEESGLKRIVVIDNGTGMSLEDIKESFKPHTTSKLFTTDDLSAVKTLGFRGEALSSIAAISKLTIQSRTKKDTAGTMVLLNEGKVEKISPVGIPVGTQITVENLFYPVPARKKFLKSQRTEFRHVIETMTHFALSFPTVRFVLTHNGKTFFDLPKTTDILDRVAMLLGKDIFASLIPISYQDGYITLSGFLTKPQVTAKTPYKQYLFINNRKITDKGIVSAITSAYGTLLDKHSYPLGMLFLSIPFEIVDVNVHPRKEEVRFVDQKTLYYAVEKAVTQTLVKHDISYQENTWGEELFKSTNSYAGRLLKDENLPWKLAQAVKTNLSEVIQMHDVYMFAETSEGLALFDQHAVHERILYEQFKTAFQKHKKEKKSFQLSKAKVIDLGISQKELLEENLSLFEEFGFGLEHFKGTSFLLRSVPMLLHDRDHKKMFIEMLEDLEENKSKSVDAISNQMIAYLACRGAVKAGDSLTKKQMQDLLQQLEKTPNNATCPHGRPTKIAVSLRELHRMFKR